MNPNALKRHPWIVFLDQAIDIFIVFNIVAITLLAFTQVVLRYVLRMPLMGIEELCYFPTTWLYLGGAVKASSEKTQLVARVLEIVIRKQKWICLLRSLGALMSAGVLCWLTWWGYDYLRYALRLDKLTDSLFIRWAYAEGTVFLCMALMLFYSALECLEYYHAYRTTSADEAKIIEEVIG